MNRPPRGLPYVTLEGTDFSWSSQKYFRSICGALPDAFMAVMQSPVGRRAPTLVKIEAALARSDRPDLLAYFRRGVAEARVDGRVSK